VQPPVTLAVRKKQLTWTTIHDSSVALARALPKGSALQALTVEEIALHAGVSPRTFFNYFAAKDDAVLGVREPQLAPEAVAAFAADTDGDLLTRIARFMGAVMWTATARGTSVAVRRQLLQRFPELHAARFRFFDRAEELLREPVLATLVAEGHPLVADGETAEDAEDAEDAVRVLVSMAAIVSRSTFRLAPEAGPEESRPALDEAVARFRAVYAGAR
jgi:AcrR family transcriptional regulator